MEVDIFGGEKKNVTGKGGKYFKREYTFCRGGDELGRTIFGEGQYFFAEEKNTEKVITSGVTTHLSKEIGKITISMVMEPTSGQMVDNTKEIGKT